MNSLEIEKKYKYIIVTLNVLYVVDKTFGGI